MLSTALLTTLAVAAPHTSDSAAGFTSDEFDQALEAASGRMGDEQAELVLWAQAADGAWVPAEQLLPSAPPVPIKEHLSGPPVDHPGQTTGILTGKAIYASQCHGWIWSEYLGRFATQRGAHHDTVEDLHNPEGMNQYLIRYLENAGAMVYTTKERDHTTHQAIADHDSEGYSETGEGFEDGPAGFVDSGPWAYGENPFDAGGTRRFPSSGGGVAKWIPEVPAEGMYAIYVSWDSDPANSSQAHYQITHPGGVIDRHFDQRVHGSTWQYVETLWLPAGIEGLTVELIGDGDDDAWLSADAVRIGGGMGVVTRHGVTTGRPSHEEGAILYNQYNGAPTSVYDPYGDGDGSDPSTRSRWAAWEHPSGEDAVYLSWHSNAFDGTARGTVTYHYSGDYTPVSGSSQLAQSLQDALMDSIRTTWDSDWYDRGIKTAAFSELSPYHNDEMPAALVELAFHDNELDAWYLKEPTFRRDMARAMMHGIIRYFADRDGTAAVLPPEPPVHLSVRHNQAGRLIASWAAGPSGGIFGDPADSYIIQTSDDGRSWDGGEAVSGTRTQLEVEPGTEIYVRVLAVNGGGQSFPTETLGARRSPDGRAPVLVVSAFDRLEGSNLVWEDIPTLGEVVRMPLERVNNFDTTVPEGRAVAKMGWYFDSVADELIGEIDLEDYEVVIWSAGQESTEHETLSHTQQNAIRTYHSSGGALLISGSEILWDLDHLGDVDDQAFARDILRAGMSADDAGTTQATGQGLLERLILDFGEPDGAPYPVGYPDALDAEGEVIATYADGQVAGALAGRVALLGFPFEAIGDPETRHKAMARLLPVLAPDYSPPGVEAGDTGAPTAQDTGSDDPDDLPQQREDKSQGCGCTATQAPSGQWAFLVLGALGLARRRA